MALHTHLQHVLEPYHQRLDADPAGALHTSGLPHGIAYLALPLLTALRDWDDRDDVSDTLSDLGRDHRTTIRTLLKGDISANLCQMQPDDAAWQACEALIEGVRDKQIVRWAATIRQGMSAGVSITNSDQVIVEAGGTLNKYAAPPDPAQARQQDALIDYLLELKKICNVLQLAQIDEQEAGKQEMHLEQVYISLNVQRQVEMTKEEVKQANDRDVRRRFERGEKPTRSLRALEALNDPHPARLLLLGAPGSGKSTFVNHLAYCLAGAALADLHEDEPGRSAWLEKLPGWTLGPLLPVRVILRDLATFEGVKQAQEGSQRLLLEFLQHTLKQMGCAEALDPIKQHLKKGTALLLFDGLDEVVGDEHTLPRVVEIIRAASERYEDCPVLVTCRVLDYQTNPKRHLAGFQVDTLAPLDKPQINEFITAWYREMEQQRRLVLGTAAGLQQAVADRERPELGTMAEKPLLLTMMAIVHAGKGKLPPAEALLYYECIDLLLLRWRKGPDNEDVLQQLKLPRFNAQALFKAMARLGFVAHENAERDQLPADQSADLSGDQVRTQLEAAVREHKSGDDAAAQQQRANLVNKLLFEIASRNGVLLKRLGHTETTHQRYYFPHRGFQEFLAGYHISLQHDRITQANARADAIHWHRALRLMVSFQVRSPTPELDRPLALAEVLLKHESRLTHILAGELLGIVGLFTVEGYRADLLQPGALWQQARDCLLTIATEGTAPDIPAPLRARAGEALGELQYGTVEEFVSGGAVTTFPDPRLLDLATGTSPDGRYWCRVEAGTFWYGDDRKEKLKKVRLNYDFHIARYPVTNAEYARFIAADGYNPDQPWWTEQGRIYISPEGERRYELDSLKGKAITLPRLWDDSRFNNSTQPVVGVSWWEAAAYCRWLTEQGHMQGWLDPEQVIRLPTSLESERAARHTDQRPYPWGWEEPSPEHANYEDTGIGRPSPVGCFPAGAAVCGAQDMVGNVFEWLATPNKQRPQVEAAKDVPPDEFVMLTWSAYFLEKDELLCGSRDYNNPYIGYFSRGFRVIQSLRSSD